MMIFSQSELALFKVTSNSKSSRLTQLINTNNQIILVLNLSNITSLFPEINSFTERIKSITGNQGFFTTSFSF